MVFNDQLCTFIYTNIIPYKKDAYTAECIEDMNMIQKTEQLVWQNMWIADNHKHDKNSLHKNNLKTKSCWGVLENVEVIFRALIVILGVLYFRHPRST